MMTTKIILTEQQETWLAKHFKHTKNAEIAQMFGISPRSVARLARARGLNKSRQFMRKCNNDAQMKAKESHLANGTYPPKGYVIPKSELYRFGAEGRKKVSPKKRAEMIRKSLEIRKLERARVVFGLPQETKLRVKCQPRAKIQLRYYLKKKGYIVDDVARIAYYTEHTQRGTRLESSKQRWYKFHPYSI